MKPVEVFAEFNPRVVVSIRQVQGGNVSSLHRKPGRGGRSAHGACDAKAEQRCFEPGQHATSERCSGVILAARALPTFFPKCDRILRYVYLLFDLARGDTHDMDGIADDVGRALFVLWSFRHQDTPFS